MNIAASKIRSVEDGYALLAAAVMRDPEFGPSYIRTRCGRFWCAIVDAEPAWAYKALGGKGDYKRRQCTQREHRLTPVKKKKKGEAPPPPLRRSCTHCGVDFQPNTHRHKLCSKACRKGARSLRDNKHPWVKDTRQIKRWVRRLAPDTMLAQLKDGTYGRVRRKG